MHLSPCEHGAEEVWTGAPKTRVGFAPMASVNSLLLHCAQTANHVRTLSVEWCSYWTVQCLSDGKLLCGDGKPALSSAL